MSNHIPNSTLKEKKLNLTNKATNLDDINLDEFTKNQKRKKEEAILVYNEIMEVFKKYNMSVQDTYYILASILEGIYAYSLLDELGLTTNK